MVANLPKIFSFFEDETLITVTADHSHVFTIGAYPKRGNPMFTIVREADGELALSQRRLKRVSSRPEGGGHDRQELPHTSHG